MSLCWQQEKKRPGKTTETDRVAKTEGDSQPDKRERTDRERERDTEGEVIT